MTESMKQLAERLSRVLKLALDTGEAASEAEALEIFSRYRVQLVFGADLSEMAGGAGQSGSGVPVDLGIAALRRGRARAGAAGFRRRFRGKSQHLAAYPRARCWAPKDAPGGRLGAVSPRPSPAR